MMDFRNAGIMGPNTMKDKWLLTDVYTNGMSFSVEKLGD